MKIFKALLLLLLLLGGAWAGTSYYIGGEIQKEYTAAIAEHAKCGPLTVTSREYRRGFLTSSAITHLEMALPGQSGQDHGLDLTLEQTIHHGPLPMRMAAGGGFPTMAVVETRLEAGSIPQGIPELKDALVVSAIGFDGVVDNHATVPAFTANATDGQIVWGGMTADIRYADASGAIQGNVSAPNLELREGEVMAAVRGVSAHFDATQAFPFLYAGNSTLTVDTIEINAVTTQPLELNGVEISTHNSAEGSLFHATQRLALQELHLENATHGPAVCEAEFKNLDGQALGELRARLIQEFSHLEQDPDQAAARLEALYKESGNKLLSGQPEFNIPTFHVATAMGDAEARVHLRLATPGATLDNPLALLFGLEASAEIKLHETLLKSLLAGAVQRKMATAEQGAAQSDIAQIMSMQIDSQIEDLIAKNLIVRDNGALKGQAEWNRGKLRVNGQDLNPF